MTLDRCSAPRPEEVSPFDGFISRPRVVQGKVPEDMRKFGYDRAGIPANLSRFWRLEQCPG